MKLKEFRNRLIELDLSRNVVNRVVQAARKCFKWAVSEELISASVHQALLSIESLRKNRSAAREIPKVKSINLKNVYAVLPYTTQVIADMIQVQLLTGLRSGELVIMRPGDIVRDGDILLYYPYKFKGGFAGNFSIINQVSMSSA